METLSRTRGDSFVEIDLLPYLWRQTNKQQQQIETYICYAQITEFPPNQLGDKVMYVKAKNKSFESQILSAQRIKVIGVSQALFGWIFIIAKVGVRDF